jgi:hypothetical protein
MDNLSLKISPLLKALRLFGLKKESTMLIENQNIYKKAISQKRINDLKEWLGGDYSKLSFDDLFDGKLRISIPFDPPQRRMLIGLVEKLIEAGWKLPTPDVSGEAFKINKVEQKITLPGGKVSSTTKDVADLKLSKSEQIVIPSGPRAGQMTTRKTESSISKIISNPANNIPKEYSDWWNTVQQKYAVDLNWREIESLFEGKNDLDKYNYVIIISRDPIDVLRMSDHKKIDSCHSEGKNYFHCAIAESRGNAPIAYIVSKSDLEKFLKERKVINEQSSLDIDKIDISLLDKEEIFADITRGISGISPEGRLKFRKYEDIEYGVEFAVPEVKAYGMDLVGFSDVLRKWAWDRQKDIFEDDNVDGGIYLPEKHNIVSSGGSYRNNPDSELLNLFFKESGKEKAEENTYSGDVEHNTNEMSEDEIEAENLNTRFSEYCAKLNKDNPGAIFYASAEYDDGIISIRASVDIDYEIFLAGISKMSDAKYLAPEIIDEINESDDIFDINENIYHYIAKNTVNIKEFNGEFFLSFRSEFLINDPEDPESVFSFLDEIHKNVVDEKNIVLENIISRLESQELIKNNNFEEIYKNMSKLKLNHFHVSSDATGFIKSSLNKDYADMYIPIDGELFFGINKDEGMGERLNRVFGSNKIGKSIFISPNEAGVYKFLGEIKNEVDKQLNFDFYKDEDFDYSVFSDIKNVIENVKIKINYDYNENHDSISGYDVFIENFSFEIFINKINTTKEIKFLLSFLLDVDKNYEQIYMLVKDYVKNKLSEFYEYYKVMVNNYLDDGLRSVKALLNSDERGLRRFALWCKTNWENFNFFQKDFLIKNEIKKAIDKDFKFIYSLNNFGRSFDSLNLPFSFSRGNLIIEQNKIDYSSVD